MVQLSDRALNPTTSTEPPVRADIGSRIVVQRRSAGASQPIKDAAAYILRIPSPSAAVSLRGSDSAHILSELRAHLAILRECPSAIFMLILRPVPEPGTVNRDVEALARTRELTRMQLTGCRETNMAELTAMINSVYTIHPLASLTAWILRGIDWMRLRIVPISDSDHIC